MTGSSGDRTPSPFWIDSHAHLDAAELNTHAGMLLSMRSMARELGVKHCVIPAVCRNNFDAVRHLAHQLHDVYALGIHPLFTPQAEAEDLQALDTALHQLRDDPRLVAVGEIGLDFFVPALCTTPMRERQLFFYREQLKLARRHQLPVILHVRRSVDMVLKHLRECQIRGGIAHAFNGSEQQAQAFLSLGFKLGFGGATSFETARQLRRLACGLPLSGIVLETDAPDIPPQWLYRTATERRQGQEQGINTPAELPRIGELIAQLRGISVSEMADTTSQNVLDTLPKLGILKAMLC